MAPDCGVQRPSLERWREGESDDGVAGIVGVHEQWGRRHRSRSTWSRLSPSRGGDPDEAVGDEDDVVAGDREILDVARRAEDGPAAAGQRTGGDHDVCLRAVGGAGEEVQLAGDRVVLRERGERRALAGEVDTAERVESGVSS